MARGKAGAFLRRTGARKGPAALRQNATGSRTDMERNGNSLGTERAKSRYTAKMADMQAQEKLLLSRYGKIPRKGLLAKTSQERKFFDSRVRSQDTRS
jgi:hypothetical protein